MNPTAQLSAAILRRDHAAVAALLADHPDPAAALNGPIGHFGAPAAMAARDDLGLLDLLLAHGADINARSHWWAGSFGILDGVSPELALELIARGAELDLYAAAQLCWTGEVRRLVAADPSAVHRRFGDGQTALHGAATVEIAELLLDAGAAIDARCVDHESTPAQYAVGDRVEVASYLVDHGAEIDIFLAVALGERALVERALAAEPDGLSARINRGRYAVRHNGREPAPAEATVGTRGDIYRWTLGHDLTPLDVAHRRGHAALLAWLAARATPAQRLCAACAAGDADTARALVAEHAELPAALDAEGLGLLAHAARDRAHAAVALMLELGWPVDARGQHGGTPLHWAAWRADLPLVELLLGAGAPLEVEDFDYQSTPLGWAAHAAGSGWDLDRPEDYPPVTARLLAAGAVPRATWLPCAHDEVDTLLREALSRGSAAT